MFDLNVVDNDKFLDLPLSTQALYFHLGMRSDDDGFVGNAQRILRYIGGKDDDFKLLVAKGFVYMLDSGIVVVMV